MNQPTKSIAEGKIGRTFPSEFIHWSDPIVGAARTREIVTKTWGVEQLAAAGELAPTAAS